MIGDEKVNLGPFATLFGHGFGFFDDRKAWGRGPDSAFGPARRFSTYFGCLGRCAQGGKNWGHGPADLLGGRRTRAAFPGQAALLDQRTGQHQLVEHGSHQPSPALKLLRGAQAGPSPQQGLLAEAVTMLLRVAPLVERPDLSQRGWGWTYPEKPTHTGVALTVSRRHPRVRRITVPSMSRACFRCRCSHASTCRRCPFSSWPSHTRSGGPCVWGASHLKRGPSRPRSPAIARAGGCGPIEDPVLGKPDQLVAGHILARSQKRRVAVAAISDDDGPLTGLQARHQVAQLLGSYLPGRLSASDAPMGEQIVPTAGRLRQHHQRRKLPAGSDWFTVCGQIGHVHLRPIRGSWREGPGNTAAIQSQQQRLGRCGLGGKSGKQLLQLACRDTPVLEGFVQTRPAPLEERRE